MKQQQENSSRMTGNKCTSRMKIGVFCSALFVSLFLSVASGAAFEVILKPAVLIEHDKVFLKDLLTADSRAACTDDAVLKTLIAQAPRPGTSRQISRALVALRLKNNKIDIREFAFSGAQTVAVEREGQAVTPLMVENYMMEVLTQKYAIVPDHTRITIENMPKPLLFTRGELFLTHDANRVLIKNGCLHLRLIVRVNGRTEMKRMISAKIYEKRDVIVAQTKIRPRTVIDDGQLAREQIFVPFDAAYCATVDDVAGKLAVGVITAGEAITFSDLKAPPAVRKGDAVDVTILRKNMSITVMLHALEAGAVGESIRLYSRDTRKHFTGTVTGDGSVEVAL